MKFGVCRSESGLRLLGREAGVAPGASAALVHVVEQLRGRPRGRARRARARRRPRPGWSARPGAARARRRCRAASPRAAAPPPPGAPPAADRRDSAWRTWAMPKWTWRVSSARARRASSAVASSGACSSTKRSRSRNVPSPSTESRNAASVKSSSSSSDSSERAVVTQETPARRRRARALEEHVDVARLVRELRRQEHAPSRRRRGGCAARSFDGDVERRELVLGQERHHLADRALERRRVAAARVSQGMSRARPTARRRPGRRAGATSGGAPRSRRESVNG